jgi:D-alanine transaminase
MSIAYLNGGWLPLEEVRVSAMDRGFIFGDGIYEVVPVFGPHVLRLREHLLRLNASLEAIYMENPHSEAEWGAIIDGLLQRNPGADNRGIYLQITRGAAARDHALPENPVPTVFGTCRPIPDRDYSKGLSAITHEDIRWQYCDIKAISLLPSVLLRERAKRRDGSNEAILLRDGVVTEGAASNVFAVFAGRIRTPAKSKHLLPGITRDLVVELLNGQGPGCEEAGISAAELAAAEEVWITSSTMGIAPVTRLDGRPVGQGVPGPQWRAADALYQAFKRRPTDL